MSDRFHLRWIAPALATQFCEEVFIAHADSGAEIPGHHFLPFLNIYF